MDWGKKLRKITESAKQAKLAKEELIKHVNSDLGKALKKEANNGLTRFNWNNSSAHRVCHSDISSMISNYGDKVVISAFETIGLKFSYNQIFEDGHRLPFNDYTISWE